MRVYVCPVRALQAYEEKHHPSGKTTPNLLFFCRGLANMTRCPVAQLQGGFDYASKKRASILTTPRLTQLEVQHVRPGVTILDILNAADWSSETTFQQFYHRDMQDRSIFGSVVLSSANYMLIWKQSLPKYNLRMAQGTKCLHAIRNYMRKVKLKYQHVPPYTRPYR